MPITAKTLDFLVENRLQNSREWYAGHKAEFREAVLSPMVELTERLTPYVSEIDPLLITEPKVDKCISRVYRDTRFSRDKSLYRDVMWCVFMRDKKAYTCPPAFVLEFSPDGFRYGCGYYDAPAKTMEAIRGLILSDDKDFMAAQRAYESQSVFAMEGELYKRSRFLEEPPKKRQWLDRRGIAFMHNSKDFSLLFSEGLSERVGQDFMLLAPIYRFFCKAMQIDKNSL